MRAAMRLWVTAALGLLAALGASCDQSIPAPRCLAVAGDPTPSATAVCAHLQSMGCMIGTTASDCPGAYAEWQGRLAAAEFNRVTSCYQHASACDALGQCQSACGSDGGAVTLADASVTDAGDVPDVPDASVPDAADAAVGD